MTSQSTALKAIPTTYAHVDFRSRLEARWAVFFDLLALPWEYEPERVRVDGVYYAPDFLVTGLPFVVAGKRGARCVPVGDLVMEVKPDADLPGDAQVKLGRYVKNRASGLILLKGPPATVEAAHYRVWQGQPEATRVQFGRCATGVGLYCLWTRRGDDDLEKPWQAQPTLAQDVFEACFLGQVGEARKAAARWTF
jgi:hypothetical protein